MRNLLKETEAALERYDRQDRVLWVGSRDGSLAVSWDDFKLIAGELDYDSGYGSQKIAKDLVVVGSGWWMRRWEYDGSEGWEMIEAPVKKEGRPFHGVGGNDWMWPSLAEAQKESQYGDPEE